MTTTTLVTLTVIEIVALVAVLAVYLIAIVARLRSVADTLAKVAFGVRALEVQITGVGPALRSLNGNVAQLADQLLPTVAAKAEAVARR